MRKQVGQIDAGLLAQVDALAADRGQTRRVVVERALEAVLSEARSGSSDAPLPAKGVEDTASVSSTVIPTAQPRTHGGDTAVRREIAKQISERPLTTPPGLRSNGHLPSCKCWRCEKEGPT